MSGDSSIMEELISIIIPVYNVENYIEKCLESLIHQTYRNLQIILVDDGSSDKSGSICDEYAKRDPRIHVLHQENQGVSKARNNGLLSATGKYIGFCDADDWVEPDMYEYLYQLLAGSKCNVASCGVWLETDTSKHPVGYAKKKVLNLNVEEAIAEIHLRRYTSEWVVPKLFERTVLEGLVFDEKLKIAEDYVYTCAAIEKSTGVICGNEIKYHYIQRKTSAVNNGYSDNYEKAVAVIKQGIDYYMQKFPSQKKEIMARYIMEQMGLLTSMIKGGQIKTDRVAEIKKILKDNLWDYLFTPGPELYFKGSAVVICINFKFFCYIYQKIKRFDGEG